MAVFETVIPAPSREVYPTHQWLDAIFKPAGIEEGGDYLWCFEDGGKKVRIRRSEQHDMFPWTEVTVPTEGEASFRLVSCPRKRVRVPGKSRKQGAPVTDPVELSRWLQRNMEEAGLSVLTYSAETFTAMIKKEGENRGFTKVGYVFTGKCVVEDPALCLSKIHCGIGDAKAYGFGILTLSQN